MSDKPDDESYSVSDLPTPKKDAFLAMPLILLGIFFLVETIVIYADISSLHVFAFELTALIIATAFLVVGIRHMLQGRYKSALLQILIIPFLVISLRSAPYVAYYIKLTSHEDQYLEEIKMVQPDAKGFRYMEFIWNIRFGAEGTRLIYDESDEWGLADATHSNSWWEKVGGRESYFSCVTGVHKIKSHFYVVSIDCG
jgi:hypothetical protein